MCFISDFLKYLFGGFIENHENSSDDDASDASSLSSSSSSLFSAPKKIITRAERPVRRKKIEKKIEKKIKKYESSTENSLILQILEPNNYLPDDIIDYTSKILRRHPFFICNRLCGFLETALLYSSCTVSHSILGDGQKKFIQIFYLEFHWITLSNWFSRDPRHIIIYDSLYFGPNYTTRRFLFSFSKLLFTAALADEYFIQRVPTCLAPVQKQSDSISCGIFAIAFAVEILNNVRPETVVFEESLMRSHLAKCIRTKDFTRFPKSFSECKRLRQRNKIFMVLDPERLKY